MINIARIKNLLRYNRKTGLFVWKETRGRAIRGVVAGTPHIKGYVSIGVCGSNFLAHRLAWAMTFGRWPVKQIDHINTDKADNRIKNLRLATNKQNHSNRGAQKNSTTGVKGVYWFKPQKSWKAQIVVGGRSVFLGYFKSKGDAIRARKKSEIKYHGRFKHRGPPTIAYAPEED